MQTITKKQLSDRVADRIGQKRVLVKKVVQVLLDEIVDELTRGNRLEFRDFGVFEARSRKSRFAQNPRTLKRVSVPLKWTVKFKVGRQMKAKVQAAINARAAAAATGGAAPESQSPPSDLRIAAGGQSCADTTTVRQT